MIMRLIELLFKCERVMNSCKTKDQINVALTYIELAIKYANKQAKRTRNREDIGWANDIDNIWSQCIYNRFDLE